MKTLEQLINLEEPGWDLVRDWIGSASLPCEVLPVAESHQGSALVELQITTRSPMGAIVYESAGIMIDHGWLRILGSGNHPRLMRSLPGWNKGRSNGFCFVADDAVGGYFAINGGGLGSDLGKVYYLAPDSLKWEGCDFTYSEFFVWSLSANLGKFYEDLRWPGWEVEAEKLSGDQIIFVYPFLSAQGPGILERSRKPVPIEENYDFLYGAQ